MNDINTAYRSNPSLKRSGVKLNYSQEELQEYLKCSQDPIYFIENYIKIIHVDRGLVPFEMYDFQKDMVRAMHENSRTIILSPRQQGKSTDYNTNIRIKNKTTGEMIEMKIGDFFNFVKGQEMDE